MKKYYIAALLTFYALVLYSQNTEWASKALNYSSQLDKFICSANQLLGKPNVLPLGGESPFAWSCGLDRNGEELKGEASVTVGFKTPLKVRQIAIGESYNPGSIKKIILISVQNKQYTVYSSIPVDTVINPRLFNLFIPLTGYEVKALKLVTEPSAVKGINQIDAIGISSSEDNIQIYPHRL